MKIKKILNFSSNTSRSHSGTEFAKLANSVGQARNDEGESSCFS